MTKWLSLIPMLLVELVGVTKLGRQRLYAIFTAFILMMACMLLSIVGIVLLCLSVFQALHTMIGVPLALLVSGLMMMGVSSGCLIASKKAYFK